MARKSRFSGVAVRRRCDKTATIGAAALMVALASVTSAGASPKYGVIQGTVHECPPSAYVVLPGGHAPLPTSITVVLVRGLRTYASQTVRVSKKTWQGSYSISVQPGTYEVISSYQGNIQRLTVAPRAHRTVNFRLINCAL